MNFATYARILAVLALRNLWSHKVKSAIVGSIMAFGTFLVVSGSAILDSVERSMERSITSSLSGNLQVYAADAKDELSLFGGFGFGTTDIGEIPDFSVVQTSLSTVPNVKAVVPMGITTATVFGGNDIDKTLAALRTAVDAQDTANVEILSGRVRRIAEQVSHDQEVGAALIRDKSKLEADREAVKRVISDEFWAEFAANPGPALDFLDGRIAPLAADGRMMYLRTIGTDLAQFQQSFDRFYVVEGEMVPDGKRGFLLSKRTYEKFLKNLVARDFDDIHTDWLAGGRIATDSLLAERVMRNSRQYQRILFQMDPAKATALEAKLRAELPEEKGDLAALLQGFLKVDDSNIERRYKFFYDEIAPDIRLYDPKIGDVITLRAYTTSGYSRSVNVRIYGTYEFHGLENSDLASASNLTDLVTWRELYGKMSSDQKQELEDISKSVGVQDVSREDAEAALFGGDSVIEAAAAAPGTGFDEFANVDLTDRAERQVDLDTKVYSRQEFATGLALNAAIILEDPSQIAATRQAIVDKIAADKLNLQVVDWQQATGLIGQFIVVMRIVLYIAIFVIFMVALVIINNSMVMATMERTAEIGTMRAIGARRGFVMALFLVETVVLGLVSGGIGALLGAVFVTVLGNVGIPAPSDILVVLFAGPRLYPAVGLSNILFGTVIILVVSLLSTLYPALLAALVPPVVAMQGKD